MLICGENDNNHDFDDSVVASDQNDDDTKEESMMTKVSMRRSSRGGILADTAASAETGDKLVSISQTSQQLAPFSTKLNSRPVAATAAAAPHPSSQAGSSLCEEEADRMIEESSDVVHCEPDTWSQRRTQLLAARQSSTDRSGH